MSLKGKRKNRRYKRRHVLDVKLRTSQRRRANLRRLVLLAVFLASVGLGALAVRHGGDWFMAKLIQENQAFKIRSLDIQTDGILAVDQVRRWAGVDLGENLFGLDLGRVKRDLELVPVIRSATLQRVLPQTLRIRVTEREPVMQAIFPEAGRRYLVDAEGYVMFPRDTYQLVESARPRDEALPRLVGAVPSSLAPGRRTTSEQVQAALGLVAAFSSSAMVGVAQLREVDVASPGILVARTERGSEVTFGLRGYERQLRRWQAIHEKARRLGQELARADLSVSNNIPAQWR